MPPKSLNVVRCREDFKKKRIKPGRRIKRLNLTVPVVRCRKLIISEQLEGNEQASPTKECLNKLNSPIARVVRDGLVQFSGIESKRTPELCQVVWSLLCRESSVRKMLIRLLQSNVSAFVGDESNLCAYLYSAWTHRDDSVRNDGLIALDAILSADQQPRVPCMRLLQCLLSSCSSVVQGYSLMNRRVERKLQIVKLINGLLRLYSREQSFTLVPVEDASTTGIDLSPACGPLNFIYDSERSSDFRKFTQLIPDLLNIVEDNWNSLTCLSDCDVRIRGVQLILELLNWLIDAMEIDDSRKTCQIDGIVSDRLVKIINTVCVKLASQFIPINKSKHQKQLTELRLQSVRLVCKMPFFEGKIEYDTVVCSLLELLDREEVTTEMQHTISCLLNIKVPFAKALSSLLQKRVLAIALKRNALSYERVRCLGLLDLTENFALLCETLSAHLSAGLMDEKLEKLLVMLQKVACKEMRTSQASEWITQSSHLPENVQLMLVSSIYLMPLDRDCLRNLYIFLTRHAASKKVLETALSNLQYRIIQKEDGDLNEFLSFILSMLSGFNSDEMSNISAMEQCAIRNLWEQGDYAEHEELCKLVVRYFGGFSLVSSVVCDGLYSLLGLFDQHEECLSNVPPKLAIGCVCMLPFAPTESRLLNIRGHTQQCKRCDDCAASGRLRRIHAIL